MELYPKIDFRKTIFQSLRVLRPEIFTRATKWPSIASRYPTGMGVSPTFFSMGGQKLA